MLFFLVLLTIPTISANVIRDNRTVAIFEMLNDVFAASLGATEDEATPMKTLEGVCIDTALGNNKIENAPYDLAHIVAYSTQNPSRFNVPIDQTAPCWPLIMIRAAQVLLFKSDSLVQQDYEDIDDIIEEIRPLHPQSRDDRDVWDIAENIVKTFSASLPRDHSTGKILRRLRDNTTKDHDKDGYIARLLDLVNLMFGYNFEKTKYLDAL